MSTFTLTPTKFSAAKINLRAESRRALLALAESCWVYAAALTVSKLAGTTRVVSPFGIFFVYWLALAVGAHLPRRDKSWRVLQWLNVGIALAAILLVTRLDLYRDLPLTDIGWLSNFGGRVFPFQRFTPEFISTSALLYVYVRGLGFATRPLTLWFVGYQFRLGVLIFFFVAIVAALAGGVEFRAWIFVFFIASLLAISLARIEESGREMALGNRWRVVLAGATLGAVALGFIVTQLFTLSSAAAFFEMLWPLTLLFQIIALILLVPLGFIVQQLVDLLAPLFSSLGRLLEQLRPIFPDTPNQTNPAFNEAVQQLMNLLPYARVLAIIAIVFGIALLIARSLNRRMNYLEEENYARESVDERDSLSTHRMKKARATTTRPREIEAENIRRIYAALLAYLAALGFPRREAETPLEFLPRLTARFPESALDLQRLTEAYVSVHYAQRQATGEQVREMRGVWQRLKKQLLTTKK